MAKPKKVPYEILDLPQGSDEWKDERRKWVTASDMASIMGVPGAFNKRDTILREKVKGTEREVSDYVQTYIYDPGHAAEAPLRKAASEALGMEFTDAVVVNRALGILASIDCVNFDQGVIVETKLSSSPKVLELAKIGKAFEPYRIQVMTQMLVTGFRRGYLFVLDGGTGQSYLIEIHWCQETADAIVASTEAFRRDVALGRTNEINIDDPRMERIAQLLYRVRDIEEEMADPMALLKECQDEIRALKDGIAAEFSHTAIYGSGVVISKAKPSERLDKDAMLADGIDLRKYTKLSKPATTVKLVE